MTKKINQAQLNPPAGSEAAIYFLHEQLLFQHVKGGTITSKFISPEAARQAFSKEPVDSGWLPKGVLRCGTGSKGVWMVSYHAPAVYTLLIEGRGGKPRKFKVPLPALVWFGQKTHYYIFAMRGKTLNPSNLLFHAPLANVNSSGLICFGKNAHPDVAKGGFDQTWHTFWQAPFNNDHSNGKSAAHKKCVNDQLHALARDKRTIYPESDLMKFGATLEHCIAKLTRRVESDTYEAPDNFIDDGDYEDNDE